MIFGKQTHALRVAISKILSNPIEHLLNMIVLSMLIGVFIFVLIINNTNIKWQKNSITYPQITVYLLESATSKDVSKLQIAMSGFGRTIVKGFQYIDKTQAAQDLQRDNNIKDIAEQINLESNNSLPSILIINTNTSNAKELNHLKNKISHLDFVNSVDIDETYVTKLSNLLSFINDSTYSVLIFFSICLILVLYNLTRLQMFQNKEEIMVSRLIGASDIFIMRPLVYYTVIQVLLSGLIAYFILNRLITSVNGLSVATSLVLGNNFHFISLTIPQVTLVFGFLILFSIFAVFFAVVSVLKRYHSR